MYAVARFSLLACSIAASLCATLLFSGCDQLSAVKDKIFPVAVNSRYPVSADTQRVLNLAIELSEDETRRNAIRTSQTDWLKLRESHCGAMAQMEKEGAAGTTGSCYAGMDKQRLEVLNQFRLAALLAKPGSQPIDAESLNVSIAFEQGRSNQKVAVSPDGKVAVGASYSGDLDIYDLVSGQRLRGTNGERQGVRLRFSANGRLLFLGKQQSRGMKVLDVYSGDELREISEVMGPFEPMDGGRTLVYADGSALGLYDVVNGKALATGFFAKSMIGALAVDQTSRHVATGTRDGVVSLWEIVSVGQSGGMTAKTLGESRLYGDEYVQEMDFLADGQQLLVMTSRGNLDLISIPALQRVRTANVPGINFQGLARIPGTDSFALLTSRLSSRGPALAVFDLVTGQGVQMDETRPATAIAAIGQVKNKLLLVNNQGMWTTALPDPASYEPLADLMVRLGVSATPPPERAVAAPNMPMASKVLPGTRVEAIGVYEGTLPGGRQRASGEHIAGTVMVAVNANPAPLVLVLSSYEPVTWIVRPSAGARITHVLLSGSSESTVRGVSGADTMRISSNYAYKVEGSGVLIPAVTQYIGRGIDRFQGAYTGSSFSIGGQGGAEAIIDESIEHKGRIYRDRRSR